MSTFDFTASPERAGSDSIKWRRYAGRDVIPMWVADMDFAAPPPVLEALQARIAQGGPQLTHFVVRVPHITRAVQALSAQGIDRGHAIIASRMTAGGLLQWQISVRDDGQRLFDGCLPTLIEWGEVHPTHNMAPSGVHLQALHISHPQASALQAAYLSLGFAPTRIEAAPARLGAVLQTPLGIVPLYSS